MARIEQVLAGEKTWGAYALDVLGHLGLGAAYSLPVIAAGVFWLQLGAWRSLAAGLIVALFGGAVRELVQGLKSGKWHPADRILDTLHHALGPPVSLGLVYLAAWLIASS